MAPHVAPIWASACLRSQTTHKIARAAKPLAQWCTSWSSKPTWCHWFELWPPIQGVSCASLMVAWSGFTQHPRWALLSRLGLNPSFYVSGPSKHLPTNHGIAVAICRLQRPFFWLTTNEGSMESPWTPLSIWMVGHSPGGQKHLQ